MIVCQKLTDAQNIIQLWYLLIGIFIIFMVGVLLIGYPQNRTHMKRETKKMKTTQQQQNQLQKIRFSFSVKCSHI